MDADIYQSSIANNAMPAAPYTRRPPSPPFIHIPPTGTAVSDDGTFRLMPSYTDVDSSQLTSRDLDIITQNATQIATDRAADWAYEQRREAQPLLDFLFLGPNSVARDLSFLQREGITMVIVARDVRMTGTPLMSIEKAAQVLGFKVHYTDIEGPRHMITEFESTVSAINDHLLAIYHSQAQGKNQDGQLIVEPSSFRRGRVLITCETGNDRSAAIAAAYIMAVFGQDMITTLQFICIQRFCCCFDEDVKRKLQSWEDILRARSQVALSRSAEPSGSGAFPSAPQAKRQIDDVMDMEEDVFDAGNGVVTDRDRFEGRDAFTPFLDHM
ncbi:protein-tyrosine phosphatase-like protein [Ilyonectria sp. MPI-CAGE-AT-0026]|nr:protein-tyrosine phosphatase-like protein [Ilyonectria sp. MPI-CAGE-AT-0026]